MITGRREELYEVGVEEKDRGSRRRKRTTTIEMQG